MFENCAYKTHLTQIYSAFSQWVIAFSDYVNTTAEMRATYNAVAFEAAAKEMRASFSEATSRAVQQITEAGQNMQSEISRNWTPKPSDFDEKVVAVYASPYIAPTVEDLEQMAEKYDKNATMLTVLYGIAESKGLAEDFSVNSPLYFANREKKLNAARALTNEIAAMCRTDSPAGLPARQSFVENFEKFEATKLNVIGRI